MHHKKIKENGHYHPITRIIRSSVLIFERMGFDVSFGPEIETEKNNFDDLNIPETHPARDEQDTFWIKDKPGTLLRTQTSAHQVPYMREQDGPFKMLSYGLVYRNEATDRTHDFQFHQIEGLAVDEKGKAGLSQMKGVLFHYIEELFGDVEKRIRPGYFPFVEPGVEVDVKFDGEWLEVLGSGMVHPNVLENGGFDSAKYQGYAFGIGIDRLAMIKYNIKDIRLLYQGDLRVIEQF